MQVTFLLQSWEKSFHRLRIRKPPRTCFRKEPSESAWIIDRSCIMHEGNHTQHRVLSLLITITVDLWWIKNLKCRFISRPHFNYGRNDTRLLVDLRNTNKYAEKLQMWWDEKYEESAVLALCAKWSIKITLLKWWADTLGCETWLFGYITILLL